MHISAPWFGSVCDLGIPLKGPDLKQELPAPTIHYFIFLIIEFVEKILFMLLYENKPCHCALLLYHVQALCQSTADI